MRAEDEAEQDTMLAQISELFSGDEPPSGESAAQGGKLPEGAAARRAYIQQHGLDRAFLDAVDRAMRHAVASPVEFVAHELLRTVEQR